MTVADAVFTAWKKRGLKPDEAYNAVRIMINMGIEKREFQTGKYIFLGRVITQEQWDDNFPKMTKPNK